MTRIGLTEILAFGLTQRTIGTVAVITAIGLEVMNQGGPDVAANLTHTMQPTMIIAAFMLAFNDLLDGFGHSAVFFFGYRMVHLGDAIRTGRACHEASRRDPAQQGPLVRSDGRSCGT